MRFVCFELEDVYRLAIQSGDQITVIASFGSKEECEAMRQALIEVKGGARWAKVKTEYKPRFDLEALYSEYPRHAGKVAGMKKLQAVIKTQEDYDVMKAAIQFYKEECVVQRRDPQYIMLFSTFVNGRYRDYVENRQTVTAETPLNFGW